MFVSAVLYLIMLMTMVVFEKGKFLIMEDFYSCTGNGQDFEVDGSINLPLADDHIADAIPVKTTCDSKVTPHGKNFIRLVHIS